MIENRSEGYLEVGQNDSKMHQPGRAYLLKDQFGVRLADREG